MRRVWVQITKLPGELRDFLTIWAIDNILGVTKGVDMVFTRHFNRARLQVLVLDLTLILISCDVVIGEDIYELQFKVESEEMVDNPSLLDMDDGNEDLGSKEGEGDDGEQEFMQEDSVQQNDGSSGRMEAQQGAQDQQGRKYKNANLQHVLDQSKEVEAEEIQWEMHEAEEAMGKECGDKIEDMLDGQGTDAYDAEP
jgi:hypothetical protein